MLQTNDGMMSTRLMQVSAEVPDVQDVQDLY